MTRLPRPIITAAYLALRNAKCHWPEGSERRSEHMARLDEAKNNTYAAINPLFDAANGKASSFTLSAFDAIAEATATEQELADLGIPKALRSGTEITVRSAGPTANAYKYTAAGTQFTLRRNSKGDWLVVNVARVDVYPKQTKRRQLLISPAARDAAISHMLRHIEVQGLE